ncbi:MAG: FecR family protein [Pseudomonadota bacterium]|nr:FecR family protein [Pseudomonadota bacterium]
MRGAVRVAVPARPVAPGVVGQLLPVGSSITTGGDGRAVITNGDQRIVVSPNSRTTLAPETGGFTRILQDLGSALFQVDRRRQPHFRVETPLLAAVVKGTTFTVSVEPQGDQVHVAEGLVEVRANSGNSVGDVAAGATAQVSRAQPGALEISTPSAAVTLEVASLTLAPLDYSEVSGGLVENVVVERPGAVAVAGGPSPDNGGLATEAVSGNAAQGGGNVVASLAELGNGGAGIGGGGNSGRGNPVVGNVGNGGGNAGGNPGNGDGGGNTGGNPGNGNGGGNVGGNPGNGGGNAGGNPGNGNGGGNPGDNPGNGNGGGNVGGNPGNGGGNAGGNSGNGNGGGNAGDTPGNGNGGGNPGNGNGDSGGGREGEGEGGRGRGGRGESD